MRDHRDQRHINNLSYVFDRDVKCHFTVNLSIVPQ